MRCGKCGAELATSARQEVVQNLKVCQFCGAIQTSRLAKHKTLLFSLFKALALIGTAIEIVFYVSRTTERAAAVKAAIERMSANQVVVQLLGQPLRAKSGVSGDIRRDETGWKEARLTIPVQGPNDEGVAYLVGGTATGQWIFSTFEVLIEKQHKKVDLVSGKTVEYDSTAYIKLHTQPAVAAEYVNATPATPRMNGEFPCVFASLDKPRQQPEFGRCPMPTARAGAVDRVEADLRYGHFVLRQTDLELNDVLEVPLTRAYRSQDWVFRNHVHAFGRNSNHSYDIAPLGTRNPYTFLMLNLEDGDFLFFDRISKGTGYANAVYQHTETSTRFYKAVISWNGDGWTTRLADGSEIRFPESYSATNAAQGAPTAVLDANGNLLELERDRQRNLQEIKTPHGHWIKFTYDNLFRIVQAQADSGQWTRYKYNAEGMLTDAVSSSGRERHYKYVETLMTEISDETGNTLLRNWYDDSWLIRQQFANGAVFSYDYVHPAHPDLNCLDKVIVKLPNNAVKQIRVCDSIPNYVLNTFR